MARWITYKGKHLLVDDDGQIVSNKKTKLYHTSNAKFNEFDNIYADSSFFEGNYGQGHYFFDDKEQSLGYGGYHKYQYEVEVDTSNFLHIKDDMGMLGQKEYYNELKKRGYQEGQNINKREFMLDQGVPGIIIEHQKPGFKKWNEYVVLDGKTIKITKRNEL